MIRNNLELTENELQNLFKRLDIDRDARATFSEFKRLFGLSTLSFQQRTFTDSLRSSILTIESPRFRSSIRSPLRNNTSTIYTSPLRERKIDILNKSSEDLDLNGPRDKSKFNYIKKNVGDDDFEEYNLTKNFNSIKVSSAQRNNLNLNTSTFRNNCISYEEENFISFLRDILDIENELEKAKIDLTYKSDFNVEDAFRNFEIDGRGFINELDIKYGLNPMDIFPTREEIALLIKRYDLSGEGIIR